MRFTSVRFRSRWSTRISGIPGCASTETLTPDGAEWRYGATVSRTSEAMSAGSRSRGPGEANVENSIEICQKNGQLDDTRLTLRDLHLIAESFAASLQGTYHPRIAYPGTEPVLDTAGKGP